MTRYHQPTMQETKRARTTGPAGHHESFSPESFSFTPLQSGSTAEKRKFCENDFSPESELPDSLFFLHQTQQPCYYEQLRCNKRRKTNQTAVPRRRPTMGKKNVFSSKTNPNPVKRKRCED